MIDLLSYLQTDVGAVLLVGTLAFLFKECAGASAGGGFDSIFPATFTFLTPLWNIALNLLIYGAAAYLFAPFLLSIGLPIFAVMVAALAYLLQKSVGWPLEQSAVLAILVILIAGIGI